jgi:hypothetical protein
MCGKFNCDVARGRDHAALGDVIAMQMLNRYPLKSIFLRILAWLHLTLIWAVESMKCMYSPEIV